MKPITHKIPKDLSLIFHHFESQVLTPTHSLRGVEYLFEAAKGNRVIHCEVIDIFNGVRCHAGELSVSDEHELSLADIWRIARSIGNAQGAARLKLEYDEAPFQLGSVFKWLVGRG